MTELENLKRDFGARRKSLLASLDKAMGISSESLRHLGSLREDMRQGLVSFEPMVGRDGSFGKLLVTTVVDGETRVQEFTIASSQEAAFLLGLKGEVQRQTRE